MSAVKLKAISSQRHACVKVTLTALRSEACEGQPGELNPHVLKSEQIPRAVLSKPSILNALLQEFQNNPLCPSSDVISSSTLG